MTTPQIRPMETADLGPVLVLEELVYPQPWSEAVFRDELTLQNRRYIVAEDYGHVVGYGGFLTVDGDAHITTLAVDPDSRRHRLGTRLMLSLFDEAFELGAEQLTLEVRVSNEGARRLYQRFGFAPVGVRKNYYLSEDALVMWAIDIRSDEYLGRIGEIRTSLEATV